LATDPEPTEAAIPLWPPPIGTLSRAVGFAADPRKLILASVGLVALWLGWAAIGRVLGESAPSIGPFRLLPTLGPPDLRVDGGPAEVAWRVAEPPRVIVSPFVRIFRPGVEPLDFARSAALGFWAVLVWGVVGGAIARIAVVEAATGRKVGLGTASRFALGRAFPLIAAPLTPMIAVAVFAAGCAGFGLLYRLPNGVGSTIAAIFTFLPLLAGLAMALILLGLAAAWPLMHATVAAEGEDTPDALSRSYSYVNQRLARYAVLAASSWAIGVVGLILAVFLARVVVGLSDWGVALGAPDPVKTTDLADTIRDLWLAAVALLVQAWTYSYFWSAASIIYLLLRRDVDGTEIHDVYLPEHELDTFAGDPPTPASPPEAPVASTEPAAG